MVEKQKKILRFDKENKLIIENNNPEIEQKEEEEINFSRALSLTTEFGLSIALPIAGGAFLGHIIDQRLATAPRMTLFFIFLGIVVAVYTFYKMYKDMFD